MCPPTFFQSFCVDGLLPKTWAQVVEVLEPHPEPPFHTNKSIYTGTPRYYNKPSNGMKGRSTMRVNGWVRAGIVASVIWMVAAPFYWEARHNAGLGGEAIAAAVVLIPAWIGAFIVFWIGRWVVRGFTGR